MRRNRTDYAINRYYSPETGRFTTHDPLTELDRPERLNQPQGLNLYPYVMGGPTRYTDPDGRDWYYKPEGGQNYLKWFSGAAGPGFLPCIKGESYGYAVETNGEGVSTSKRVVCRNPKRYNRNSAFEFKVDASSISAAPVTKSSRGPAKPRLTNEERGKRQDEADRFRATWANGVGTELSKLYAFHFVTSLFGGIGAAKVAGWLIPRIPLIGNSITTIFSETPLPGVFAKTGKAFSAVTSWVAAKFGNKITTIFSEAAPKSSPGLPPSLPSGAASKGSNAASRVEQELATHGDDIRELGSILDETSPQIQSQLNESPTVVGMARDEFRLASQQISRGHAYSKHVIDRGEFPGISTQEEFAGHIEAVMNNPSASRNLSNGRSAYWDDASGTVVIRDPRSPDGGTAFKPTRGRAFFEDLY